MLEQSEEATKNSKSRDNWAQQMQYEAKQNKTKQYNTREKI
jgi:hypothetical protein